MGRPRLDQPNFRLRLRGGVHYIYWTENGQTQSVSTRTRDERQAKAELQRFLAGRAAGIPPEQPTIGEILDGYLADRKGRVEAFATLEHSCKPLRAAFGDLDAGHLSRTLARLYARSRREAGRRDGTIIRELVTLRAAFNWAYREEWTESVPYVELPPSPVSRDRWLTRDEAQRLLDECASRHLRLFTLVALHTGARAGAILDLAWDRVDLAAALIVLGLPGRTHAAKRRAVVPINATLDRALRAARDIAVTDHVIEYAGKPVMSVKMAFRRAAARAGLDVSPHDLRRTAATWMVQAGIPLAEVARYLGDTEKMVERVYGRHGPEYLRRASRALEG